MEITHNNYEAYLLDWIEGKLSKELQKQLEDFLEQNPSIKESAYSYQPIALEPQKVTYNHKTELYRLDFERTTINEINYSEFCIALYENILTEKKRNELFEFASRSIALKDELSNFRKVYLESDDSIIFEHKALLYKTISAKKTIKIPLYMWLSAAAGFALLISIYVSQTENIARTTKPVVSIASSKVSKSTATLVSPIVPEKIDEVKLIVKRNNIPKPIIEETPIKRDQNELYLKPILVSQIEAKTQNPEMSIAMYNFEKRSALYLMPEEGTNIIGFQKNSILALAESGINRFGKLTGSNIEISHQTDDNGKISSFRLRTGFFEISRKRNR